MTFSHPPVRRPALWRAAVVLLGVGLLARCADDPTGSSKPALPSLSPVVISFNPGDRVKTTGTANVRSGPSGSASQVGTQPVGALGSVLAGPIVDSTGDKLTRFNVNFDTGPDGWVAQEYAGLTLVSPAPTGSVASVTVTPAPDTLTVGSTVQLTATPRDSAGNVISGQAITWVTSAPGVATVSTAGLAAGVAAGSATVTASAGGKSGAASVVVKATPPPPPPPPPGTFAIGARVQSLGANIRSGPTVSATLLGNQPSGALGTIVGGPVVDSTGDGLTRWNVNFDSGVDGWAAQGYLTVVGSAPPPPSVASVTIAPSSASLTTGATLQLAATLKDSAGNVLTGRTIAWTSSATGVATVSAAGLVTGVAAGSVTISATSGGKSGTAAVTVTTPVPVSVASVTIAPSTASVAVAATVQLAATLKDSAGNVLTGRTITWSSSAIGVATVSATGLVTGVAAGSATITAASGGKSATAAISVTAPPPPPSGTFAVGARVQSLGANIRSGPSISATLLGNQPSGALGTIIGGPVVDSSGDKLTRWNVNFDSGVDGWAAQGYLTVVTPPSTASVASVTVSPSSAPVGVGSTVQLTATLKDSAGNVLSGRTITWTTSSSGIATVSAAGLVTGVAAGSATITATSGGKSGSATVTVTAPATVASVTVTPSTASVAVGATVQLAATLKDSAGNVLTGRTVSWASSATSLATVSSSGLVSGVAAGSATVTATAGGTSGTAAITVTAPPPGSSQFGHVFVVVEENTDYASVIGTSAMPYLNSLVSKSGLATQYYANTHPSIGNYFMLTTGQVITNNDSYTGTVTADNIVRHLVAAGKTWKAYAEDLPSVGYLGLGDNGTYASRHNPVVYLSDVRNDATQALNVVPFTQLSVDLAAHTLPQFGFIVPNLCDDAHDCGLGTADTWLKNKVAPLIASPEFQQDGLLIIVFDESSGDNTNGGGRVVWVAVSPKAKPGYTSTTTYQHQNTLRTILQGLGVTSYPGAAASATGMGEFFNP